MQDSLTYTLHKLVFSLDRAADTLLRDAFDISYRRALVLVVLQDQPGITQHQLAQALGHTDPAVSALLAELAKDGFVDIQVSSLHKRKKEVQLTAKGKDMAAQTHQYLMEKLNSLLLAANVDGALYDRLTKQLYNTLIQKEK